MELAFQDNFSHLINFWDGFGTNTMDFHQQIGLKLRDLRRQQHLTLSQMSEYLHLSYQQIQKYERGVSKIPLDKLVDIAHLLKVPVSAFFEETNCSLDDSLPLDPAEEIIPTADRPLKIWLAESDPVDEFIMRQLLSELDEHLTVFCIHSAQQMTQVLTKYIQHPLFSQPDLLFLDIAISKQEHHELLAVLRERLPHTPILVFTYHIQRRELDKLLRRGANGVILKSTQAEVLKKTLASILHYWQQVAILPSKS